MKSTKSNGAAIVRPATTTANAPFQLRPECMAYLQSTARRDGITAVQALERVIEDCAARAGNTPCVRDIVKGLGLQTEAGFTINVPVTIGLDAYEWQRVSVEARRRRVTIDRVLSDALQGQYARTPSIAEIIEDPETHALGGRD